MWRGWPVSYTHLDVYKRQILVYVGVTGAVQIVTQAAMIIFMTSAEQIGLLQDDYFFSFLNQVLAVSLLMQLVIGVVMSVGSLLILRCV